MEHAKNTMESSRDHLPSSRTQFLLLGYVDVPKLERTTYNRLFVQHRCYYNIAFISYGIV